MRLLRKLFSEKKKVSKEVKDLAKIGGTVATGIALSHKKGLGSSLTDKSIDEFFKADEKAIEKFKGSSISEKLDRLARKDGIELVNSSRPMYVGKNAINATSIKLINKLPENIKGPIFEGMENQLPFNLSEGEIDHIKSTGELKKTRILRDIENPVTTAHEIGHSVNQKNKVARLAQKTTQIATPIAPIISTAGGFRAGLRRAEGKKEGIAKHSGLIAGVATSLPTLIEESTASTRGYNMLKRAGASKSQLKVGKKNLTTAFGTYAGNALVNVGKNVVAGEIGKGAGYATGKAIQTIKKRKAKKTQDKKK